jgi:NodT family efflux transporter outer membrane factor (OMF) lipoprotein
MTQMTILGKTGRGWNDQRGGFRAAAAISAGLALLAGCNLAPKYTVPPVQTPAAFKEANGWKVAQPKDDAIRGKWWETFNDPQLNVLEEQVAVSNQTVLGALATFQAARALVREARSQYYPTVGAAPSVTVGRPSSDGISTNQPSRTAALYSLPLDASWEPDLWGSIRNTVNAATFTAQADAATFQSLRLTAQADLAFDYFSLRGQDMLQKVLDDTVAADQKTLDLTKALFQAGIDSDEDVSSAETTLATVQAQAINVGVLRAQYEHAVALLVGQPASTFSIPAQLPTTNNPAIPLALPSQLLERRPDVAAAERSVAAANAQIGVAKAAFFPELTLSATGGFQSVSLGSLISGPTAFWSLGAAVAQTVFDGGLRSATVAQYRATYNSTVANYRETVLTAFQQVEDYLAALRILSKEWEQQEAAVQSAARTLAISTHRYELGIDSYLNVLVAQATLLSNEQVAVGIQTQLKTSSVQLILALGGGWDTSQMPSPRQVTTRNIQ